MTPSIIDRHFGSMHYRLLMFPNKEITSPCNDMCCSPIDGLITNKKCFICTQVVSEQQENYNVKDGDTSRVGGELPQ
jgi:hypothetical protein